MARSLQEAKWHHGVVFFQPWVEPPPQSSSPMPFCYHDGANLTWACRSGSPNGEAWKSLLSKIFNMAPCADNNIQRSTNTSSSSSFSGEENLPWSLNKHISWVFFVSLRTEAAKYDVKNGASSKFQSNWGGTLRPEEWIGCIKSFRLKQLKGIWPSVFFSCFDIFSCSQWLKKRKKEKNKSNIKVYISQ